ncbi:thioesterase II family protein [Actinophytocola sp. NPDC049390]|uniref:thioesterase II family protein n=1 Tax=Actinophytocola sp. NPDC049390 TaxID=3363894 RepID=UPI003799F5FE
MSGPHPLTQGWLVPFAPVGERPVLVCLPQAGSGCGAFRSWQEHHDDVSVVGVQLPGRENRFTDEFDGTFADAVAEIVAALTAAVPSGLPIVLFGHSLGGLLGYEVARALPNPPDALVVAASRPPHLSGRVAGSMGAADGVATATNLLAGKELDDDVRELVLEVLRQDAELSATYTDPAGAPVPCPLHAWGGAADEVVTAEHVGGWAPYADRTFHTRQFAGGHDFCLRAPEAAAAARALLTASVSHSMSPSMSQSRQGV